MTPPFAPGDRARVTATHLALHGREVVVRSAQPIGTERWLLRVTPVSEGESGGQWPVFSDELEPLVPPGRTRPIKVGRLR